jgi:polyhydroxybutyrate depolymerase
MNMRNAKLAKSRTIFFVFIVVIVAFSVGIYLMRTMSGNSSFYVSFEFDGRTRRYMVHIPLSYDGSNPTPLVISLHGYGGNARSSEQVTGFTEKSDKEGFIAVYPEGIGQSWNGPYCCGEAYSSNVDDVGFIRELINRLEQEYNIDPDRIYVAGFSNGAIMAYRLAAELSDKIAAIAPVAGSIGGKFNGNAPLRKVAEPLNPVSVVIFHGTNDTSIYYYGGLSSNGLFSLSVAESTNFWVNHDGCAETPQTEISPDGNTVKDVYAGGKNSTEVVLYTLVGFGHNWPATATDIIWDFFVSHPKQ